MRRNAGGGGGGGRGSSNSEVLLGGSKCVLGATPSKFRNIVNDQLLCLKCMCEVVRFADFQWADDVDYMFFRNYWPEPERLLPKMIARKGCAAYCCQCSWKTVDAVTVLPAELRWRPSAQ